MRKEILGVESKIPTDIKEVERMWGDARPAFHSFSSSVRGSRVEEKMLNEILVELSTTLIGGLDGRGEGRIEVKLVRPECLASGRFNGAVNEILPVLTVGDGQTLTSSESEVLNRAAKYMSDYGVSVYASGRTDILRDAN